MFSLGRLVKRKGIVWFLNNVYTRLQHEYSFLIAGDGVEFDIIESIINQQGFKSVRLLGRVNDKDKITLMSGSNVFIMPNIKVNGDWEGFGIVNIESSLHGTPVLAANLEGITAAVVPGKTGMFFEAENDEDFISNLNKLIKLRIKPESISKSTVENYSYDILSDKYINIFKQLLN